MSTQEQRQEWRELAENIKRYHEPRELAAAAITALLDDVDRLTAERDAWRNQCNAVDAVKSELFDNTKRALLAACQLHREANERADALAAALREWKQEVVDKTRERDALTAELAQVRDERDEEWATAQLGLS